MMRTGRIALCDSRTGFTLVEVLVALVLLGALVLVGVEGTRMGTAARTRAADYADLRLLAEQKLAEVSSWSGVELRGRAGATEGRFGPPFEGASWMLRIDEQSAPGLFRVEVEARRRGAALRVVTYVDRFGELWASREVGRP